MRACESFGRSGENLGSNPILGRIWPFLAVGKAFFLNLTLGPFFLSLCCAGVNPLAAYAHSAGFTECRAYFSHETGLLTPKYLKNFRCAGLRGGCFAPHRPLRRTLAVTIIPVTFASVPSVPRG